MFSDNTAWTLYPSNCINDEGLMGEHMRLIMEDLCDTEKLKTYLRKMKGEEWKDPGADLVGPNRDIAKFMPVWNWSEVHKSIVDRAADQAAKEQFVEDLTEWVMFFVRLYRHNSWNENRRNDACWIATPPWETTPNRVVSGIYTPDTDNPKILQQKIVFEGEIYPSTVPFMDPRFFGYLMKTLQPKLDFRKQEDQTAPAAASQPFRVITPEKASMDLASAHKLVEWIMMPAEVTEDPEQFQLNMHKILQYVNDDFTDKDCVNSVGEEGDRVRKNLQTMSNGKKRKTGYDTQERYGGMTLNNCEILQLEDKLLERDDAKGKRRQKWEHSTIDNLTNSMNPLLLMDAIFPYPFLEKGELDARVRMAGKRTCLQAVDVMKNDQLCKQLGVETVNAITASLQCNLNLQQKPDTWEYSQKAANYKPETKVEEIDLGNVMLRHQMIKRHQSWRAEIEWENSQQRQMQKFPDQFDNIAFDKMRSGWDRLWKENEALTIEETNCRNDLSEYRSFRWKVAEKIKRAEETIRQDLKFCLEKKSKAQMELDIRGLRYDKGPKEFWKWILTSPIGKEEPDSGKSDSTKESDAEIEARALWSARRLMKEAQVEKFRIRKLKKELRKIGKRLGEEKLTPREQQLQDQFQIYQLQPLEVIFPDTEEEEETGKKPEIEEYWENIVARCLKRPRPSTSPPNPPTLITSADDNFGKRSNGSVVTTSDTTVTGEPMGGPIVVENQEKIDRLKSSRLQSNIYDWEDPTIDRLLRQKQLGPESQARPSQDPKMDNEKVPTEYKVKMMKYLQGWIEEEDIIRLNEAWVTARRVRTQEIAVEKGDTLVYLKQALQYQRILEKDVQETAKDIRAAIRKLEKSLEPEVEHRLRKEDTTINAHVYEDVDDADNSEDDDLNSSTNDDKELCQKFGRQLEQQDLLRFIDTDEAGEAIDGIERIGLTDEESDGKGYLFFIPRTTVQRRNFYEMYDNGECGKYVTRNGAKRLYIPKDLRKTLKSKEELLSDLAKRINWTNGQRKCRRYQLTDNGKVTDFHTWETEEQRKKWEKWFQHIRIQNIKILQCSDGLVITSLRKRQREIQSIATTEWRCERLMETHPYLKSQTNEDGVEWLSSRWDDKDLFNQDGFLELRTERQRSNFLQAYESGLFGTYQHANGAKRIVIPLGMAKDGHSYVRQMEELIRSENVEQQLECIRRDDNADFMDNRSRRMYDKQGKVYRMIAMDDVHKYRLERPKDEGQNREWLNYRDSGPITADAVEKRYRRLHASQWEKVRGPNPILNTVILYTADGPMIAIPQQKVIVMNGEVVYMKDIESSDDLIEDCQDWKCREANRDDNWIGVDKVRVADGVINLRNDNPHRFEELQTLSNFLQMMEMETSTVKPDAEQRFETVPWILDPDWKDQPETDEKGPIVDQPESVYLTIKLSKEPQKQFCDYTVVTRGNKEMEEWNPGCETQEMTEDTDRAEERILARQQWTDKLDRPAKKREDYNHSRIEEASLLVSGDWTHPIQQIPTRNRDEDRIDIQLRKMDDITPTDSVPDESDQMPGTRSSDGSEINWRQPQVESMEMEMFDEHSMEIFETPCDALYEYRYFFNGADVDNSKIDSDNRSETSSIPQSPELTLLRSYRKPGTETRTPQALNVVGMVNTRGSSMSEMEKRKCDNREDPNEQDGCEVEIIGKLDKDIAMKAKGRKKIVQTKRIKEGTAIPKIDIPKADQCQTDPKQLQIAEREENEATWQAWMETTPHPHRWTDVDDTSQWTCRGCRLNQRPAKSKQWITEMEDTEDGSRIAQQCLTFLENGTVPVIEKEAKAVLRRIGPFLNKFWPQLAVPAMKYITNSGKGRAMEPHQEMELGQFHHQTMNEQTWVLYVKYFRRNNWKGRISTENKTKYPIRSAKLQAKAGLVLFINATTGIMEGASVRSITPHTVAETFRNKVVYRYGLPCHVIGDTDETAKAPFSMEAVEEALNQILEYTTELIAEEMIGTQYMFKYFVDPKTVMEGISKDQRKQINQKFTGLIKLIEEQLDNWQQRLPIYMAWMNNQDTMDEWFNHQAWDDATYVANNESGHCHKGTTAMGCLIEKSRKHLILTHLDKCEMYDQQTRHIQEEMDKYRELQKREENWKRFAQGRGILTLGDEEYPESWEKWFKRREDSENQQLCIEDNREIQQYLPPREDQLERFYGMPHNRICRRAIFSGEELPRQLRNGQELPERWTLDKQIEWEEQQWIDKKKNKRKHRSGSQRWRRRVVQRNSAKEETPMLSPELLVNDLKRMTEEVTEPRGDQKNYQLRGGRKDYRKLSKLSLD
jgi:hypothetical protein